MVLNDGSTADGEMQFRDLVQQGVLQYISAWSDAVAKAQTDAAEDGPMADDSSGDGAGGAPDDSSYSGGSGDDFDDSSGDSGDQRILPSELG